MIKGIIINKKPTGSEVIKLFSCLTQCHVTEHDIKSAH